MKSESKQDIINKLKNTPRLSNCKFNVHSYQGKYSKEQKALILFSEFLKNAINGIEFIKENAFNNSNQYKDDAQILSIASHVYNSSILYYSKMFRGGGGVERENLKLKENKLFNEHGSKKTGKYVKTKQDRFYIEEFFNHNSNEFTTHHNILFKVDKHIVHIDKTDLAKCYSILVFDKKETQKYIGIDNHSEYFSLSGYSELTDYLTLFNNVKNQVNEKIRINTQTIDEILKDENNYSTYYDDLIINESEV